AAAELERLRHVAVDVDRLAVLAVAGEIGDVVVAVEVLDAANDGVERAIEHQARDIPFGQAQLPVRSFGVAVILAWVGLLRLRRLARHGSLLEMIGPTPR